MVYAILAIVIPLPIPRPKITVLICPKCRSYIPVYSKFCPECGLDLRRERKPNALENHVEQTEALT